MELPILQPECDRCGLAGGKQIRGKKPAVWNGVLVIGEAPGSEEVARDIPFIGYSGQLLRRCLNAAKIDPTKTMFTNSCLCRPPSNRTPTPLEVSACNGRLLSEIRSLKPKKILLVGATASQAVLKLKLDTARGRWLRFEDFDVMTTVHPAFVLRFPEAFRDFMQDIEKLHRGVPEVLPFELLIDGRPYTPFDVVDTKKKAEDLFESIQSGEITIDIETSNVNPFKDRFLSFGIEHNDDPVQIVPHETVLSAKEAFAELLHSGRSPLTGHNLQYEYKWIRHVHNVRIRPAFDTMLAHYVLDERSGDDGGGRGGSYHGLKTLGGVYFDIPDWSDAMAAYKADYGEAPTEILYRYQALDIRITRMLKKRLEEDLKAEGLYDRPFMETIMPSVAHLAELSAAGINVDTEYFKELDAEWTTECELSLAGIRAALGNPKFNVRSPKQVAELLFDAYKLPNLEGRSTNKDVLEQLTARPDCPPVVQALGDLRKRLHIQSTYIKGIPKEVQPDGRIHTEFLLHGTDTGRLSSRHPNLQNQPARIGSIIRDGFVASPGHVLVQMDYKQLEFRVLAYLTRDQVLIDFINSGRDIHGEVARFYFNLGPDDPVSVDQRLDAKAVVFGVIYQRTAESIAEEYKLPIEEARRRVSLLYEIFPGAKTWIKKVQDQAIKLGYVETAFGRRRRFPFVTKQLLSEISRRAVNSPIQGTASDICLHASRRVRNHDAFNEELHRLMLLVHDSLVFEIPEDQLHNVGWIKDEMERDPFGDSPIKFAVDVEWGYRWGKDSLQKYVAP